MATNYPRPFGAPAPRRQPSARPQHFSAETSKEPIAARRYEVMYLDALGNIEDARVTAPAVSALEATCGAFAHGSLITTENGDVPIEDLLPGDKVLTRDDGPQEVRWIGSMSLVPTTSSPKHIPPKLVRMTENSTGLGRPNRDIIFGEHARLLRRNAACRSLFGTEAAFAPIGAFVDGVQIIEISPISPVKVFHILLDGQHIIQAAGMEMESYHPGRRDALGLSNNSLSVFMELFPMLSDLGDFGPMRTPRLSKEDIQSLESR